MNTLIIDNAHTKEIIKEVNKHRLKNKNSWYQVKIYHNNNIHKIKAYNTWLQICQTWSNGKLIYNTPSAMDITPTQFKQHIKSIL